MARYTDEFRTGTVLLLEAAGYPQRKGALAEVAANVGVPAMTISRWFRAAQNPPPNEMVTEKRLDLIEAIEKELQSIVSDFPLARPDADYKALITAFAIMVDKLQLLKGKPTERTEHVGLSDEERTQRVMEILDTARARRDRNPIGDNRVH